jgi:hypothetical protein
MSRASFWTLALLCSAALACGDVVAPPKDAGADSIIVTPDGSVPPTEAGARLQKHLGYTLSQIQLGTVYVGDVDAGGAPNEDVLLGWLVASPYWLLLDEYGVTNGALVGTAHVPMSALLQSGDVSGGLVDVMTLQVRITSALHGDDDAGTQPTINIPGAQAYVFFLPDGVNVALGHRGSYTYQTCIDANGYHSHDGLEAYAVLPPCAEGRSLYTASHELAEMATDPRPYDGWVSDTDIATNGGEVADLCEQKIMQEGVIVTRLWSNQNNGCVP